MTFKRQTTTGHIPLFALLVYIVLYSNFIGVKWEKEALDPRVRRGQWSGTRDTSLYRSNTLRYRYLYYRVD